MPLLGTHLIRQILAHDFSNDADSRMDDVPFWVSLTLLFI